MTLMHEWSRDHFEFSRHGAPVYLFWCGHGVQLSVVARHHRSLVLH